MHLLPSPTKLLERPSRVKTREISALHSSVALSPRSPGIRGGLPSGGIPFSAGRTPFSLRCQPAKWGQRDVCVCVFIKLHITAQPGPVKLIFQCYSNGSALWCVCVCVCVCVYHFKLGFRVHHLIYLILNCCRQTTRTVRRPWASLLLVPSSNRLTVAPANGALIFTRKYTSYFAEFCYGSQSIYRRICSNSFCRCIHFGIDRYFSPQGECEFLINLRALKPDHPGTVNEWTNENVLFVCVRTKNEVF